MKKTLALFLAAMLCMGLFAACQSSTLEAYSADDGSGEETDASAADVTDATEAETTDYTPCFESYDPDEVMMTINGIDVTWRELFYWYYYDVSSLAYYYGEITDWDDTSLFNGEQSYRDYVTTNALETVKHYCALESKAADMGIELTDEDRETIDERWQSNVETYGGGDEAAFVEYLETLFLDKDLYNHINEISALYDRLLEETYGADGSKLTEEQVLEKATDMGYSHAKHIYMSFYDDESNELTDEEKAAKKARLQTILDELKTISDPATLEAKIDGYIADASEDPGKDYYPDGYTYISGELGDDTFEAAVADIGENELYPEVVESSMGYHIIYRLPLSTTAAVEASGEDTYYTLAYYVAQDMFEALADQWAEESEVEYTKAYEKMDIAKVFAKAKTGSADSDTDTGEGGDWYVIVIIVLLAAAVAVGIILIIQHERAGRAAQAESEADAEKGESREAAAETARDDSAEENGAEPAKDEEKPDEGGSSEEKKDEPEK